MSVYLDYNASTPIDERVLNVMINIYQNIYGNPDSRTHTYGEAARKTVETARQQVADSLKIRKDEVIFTSGATESNNIAILGLTEYADKSKKKHIITTVIEHKSVLEPLKYLENCGFDVTYVKPDISGRIRPEDILDNVRKNTLLVSVMHVNNETGIIQPVKEIGEALNTLDVFFHIDAAQSFGKINDELQKVKYNFLSLSAHKMYGPQGIGALIIKKEKYKMPQIKPICYGGGQEHNIRPGTLPTALIAGLGAACECSVKDNKKYTKKYFENKKLLLDLLNEAAIEYEINGFSEYCIPNTINIRFNGINSEALMQALQSTCAVSNGSACNSREYSTSYVLRNMGLTKEQAEQSLRISWGHELIDKKLIDEMISVIKKWV